MGAPLRLLVPGWYGVANVKWISQIRVQEDAYTGKYQTWWYRTIKGKMIDGELKYIETAVTHMNLKSFIARVSKTGDQHKVLGVVLNDGTPLKSVEMKVDEGAWRPAKMDPATKDKYGWKLFTYMWSGATPGDHVIVSRVTDALGRVQPTPRHVAPPEGGAARRPDSGESRRCGRPGVARAGSLARRKDVIDSALVRLAHDGDQIVTSDPEDIEPLARVLGVHVEIIRS